MIRRRLSAEATRALQRLSTDEDILPFIQISAEGITPIFAVRDSPTFNGEPMRYLWGGNEWIAMAFDLEYLCDNDGPPEAKISIQNVDQRIGEVIRDISARPTLAIYLIGSHEFDLTVNPRVGYGSPEPVPEAQALGLFLKNTSVNLISVTADIVSWDDTQESWPGTRATKDLCPGLFR